MVAGGGGNDRWTADRPAKRPAVLRDIPPLPGDELVALESGGDICVQACSDDALNEYISHVGSAVFAVPPGASKGGYVGEALFA